MEVQRFVNTKPRLRLDCGPLRDFGRVTGAFAELRVGQILELKALRQAVDDIKRSQSERERITENLITCVGELRARVQELEAKRGPGRPRNDPK